MASVYSSPECASDTVFTATFLGDISESRECDEVTQLQILDSSETIVQVAQRNKKLTSTQRNELSWLRILFKNRRAYLDLLAEDEEHPKAFALETEYARIMKHLCDSGLFLAVVGV